MTPRGSAARAGLILGGLALLSPARAHAAAWTLPEGQGLVITTATYTSGNYMLGRSGGAKVPQYNKLEVPLLLEYGLRDWLTVIGSPSFRWTTAGSPRDQFSGLGYTAIGARTRVWHDERQVVSLQTLARIPGATAEGRPAQIGNTGMEYDLRGLYGVSFTAFGHNSFANAEAAYRMRASRPDELRADLTFGIHITERWLLLAQSFTVISNGDAPPLIPSYWYTKAQLSAVYEFTPGWSLQMGVVTTYAGHQALQENGVLLGVWRRF